MTKENDPTYDMIMNWFQHKCIRCWHDAVTVHEIEYRSEGKKWWRLSNRVPLCNVCHEYIHSGKVSKYKAQVELRQAQKDGIEFLWGERLGREYFELETGNPPMWRKKDVQWD